ncbi:hypothetical protein [Myroides injenensis]|uniref:hypothetical protein n=1 Tax=Myroides injenensis TaxID=1183151 RepID=UPI0002884823|nr:hypothetical protein [Myroides injenensis]
MRYLYVLLFLLIASQSIAQENQLRDDTLEQVERLILLFKSNDKEAISMYIDYPLPLKYPIPSIETKEEFIVRFEQVFDRNMTEVIGNSTSDDWSTVGWRGTMFNNGDLWINESGKIIKVNRQADGVERWRQSLIAQDKKKLHPSINHFIEPIAIMESSKYIYRIDQISEDAYRLAAWKKNQLMIDTPLFTLLEGKMDVEGSMGNRVLTFYDKKKEEQLTILLDNAGEAPEDTVLFIYKDKKGRERTENVKLCSINN